MIRPATAVGRHKMVMKIIIFLSAAVIMGAALANPQGGVVSNGSATIQQSPGSTVIQQNSQQAIINWQSFNIGSGETTHFQQPTGGVALNRVNPQQGASQIFGTLSATGQIILINQAGIYFGSGAVVDVGGIIASTTDMSNANFLAGKYIFDQPSPYNGSVINAGTIKAANYGLVALIGTSVRNDGLIQANLGNVVLASGDKFTVDMIGDQLVNFTIDAGSTAQGVDQNGVAIKDGVTNTGSVIANGGKILMTAQAAQGVLDNVINMSGVAQAKSVGTQNGEIILQGDNEGVVSVSGTLDASGKQAGQTGGTIKVLGTYVGLNAPANIDVSGDAGGGTVNIGGDFHGAGPDYNATAVYVAPGVSINANAITNGNGGNVSVWSNDVTRFYGSISAQGGALGGNGGYIETSGDYLDVNGATINTLAPAGATGNWLLDPTNIWIADSLANAQAAGDPTNDTSASTFSGGQFAASGNVTDSFLNIGDASTAGTLENELASTNVTVTTVNASGTGSGNITVVDPISSTSTNTLTFHADNNINIDNTISISGTLNLLSGFTTASGNVNINADITAGTLNVTPTQTGIIQFTNSPLIETTTTSPSGSNTGDINFNNFFAATGDVDLIAARSINTLGTTTGAGQGVTGALNATAGAANVSGNGNIAIGNDTQAGSLTFTIDGNGSIQFQPPGTSLTMTTTSTSQVYDGPITFVNPGSPYTLFLSSVGSVGFENTGNITFPGTGTLNINAGGGNTSFTINPGNTVTVSTAGSQTYTGGIDVSGGGNLDLDLTANSQTINITNAMIGTLSLSGTGTNDTLSLQTTSATQNWSLSSSGTSASGSVTGGSIGGTLSFSGMSNFVGGSDNDTFSFTSGSTGSGISINGGTAGTKIISLASLPNTATTALSSFALGGTIGFAGNFTSNVSGSFNNITEFDTVSNAANNFTGIANTSAVWTIPANGDLSYATSRTFNFSGFTNITGSATSSGTDAFNIDNQTLAGVTITGGAGANTYAFTGGQNYSGTITPAGTSNDFQFNATDTYPISTTSTAPISITSTTNTLTIQQPVSTEGAVTISANGTITINSTIDTNGGALNMSTGTTATGDIDINSIINTAGGDIGISFGTGGTGSLNIGADVNPGAGTLTATVNQGNLNINAALTGGVGETFTTVNAGNISVNANIITNGSLTLTVEDGTLNINAPTITSAGAFQIGSGFTVLEQDSTLTGNGITIGGALDGAFNLTIKNDSTTTFSNGSIGAGTPLASLLIEGNTTPLESGQIVVNGVSTISTAGNQTYDEDMLVENAPSRGSTGEITLMSGGNITFANNPTLNAHNISIDSTNDVPLTITAGGAASFTGNVGSTALGFSSISITTTNGLTLNSNNGGFSYSVNTNDNGSPAQSYTGPVTTNGAVTFNANNGGAITFGNSVSFGGDATFNLDAGVNTPGVLTFNGALQIGAITLTVNTESNAFFNGSVTTNGVATFTSNDGGSMTFGDPVSLGGDVTFNLNPGSNTPGVLTFNGTIDGAQSLTVDTASNTVFNGNIGSTTPLSTIAIQNGDSTFGSGISASLNELNIISGTSTLGSGVTVTTSQGQFWNNIILGGGTITLGSSTQDNFISVGGTIGDAVQGSTNLVMNGGSTINGGVFLGGDIGDGGTAPASLTITVGGNTEGIEPGFGSGINITTTGNQTYNGVMFLDGFTGSVTTDAFTSNSGAIQFNGTIDNTSNLVVTAAGNISFNGDIGDNTPLNSITTSSTGAGVVSIASGVNITTANNGAAGTGNQTYNNPVQLQSGGTVTMTAQQSGSFGANIQFNSTVDGAAGLSLNAPGGDIIIDGDIGDATPVTNLSTNGAASVTQIAANITANTQNYNNNLILINAITTLSTGTPGGSININSGVSENTAGSLVLDGGTGGNTSFSIAGLLSPIPPNSITVTGGAGTTGNSLALNISGASPTWTVTGSGIGSVAGLGAPLTFTTIQNLVGGSANESFILDSGASLTSIDGGTFGTKTLSFAPQSGVLGVTLTGLGTNLGFSGTTTLGLTSFNDISVLTGSTSGANTLTGAPLNNSWSVSGTDGGTYTASSVTLPFSNFQNLNGGSGSSNQFILGAGSVLNGMITGGSGSNTYILPTGSTFTGSFQGSGSSNDYVFGNNSALTGTITGGGASSTLDFSAYSSAINIVFSAQNAGTVSNGGSTIANFGAINNVFGATNGGTQQLNNTATLANLTNTLVLNSVGQLSISDPFVTNGFNSFTGVSGSDVLTSPLPANATIVSNQSPTSLVISIPINGVNELFSFFNIFFNDTPAPTPPVPPVPPIIIPDNSNVITATYTGNVGSGGSIGVLTPGNWYYINNPVYNSIEQIIQNQLTLDTMPFVVKPNC